MLDAGYLINKKERLLVLSSISPRLRLYEPEANWGDPLSFYQRTF
jgi:hypothetical protein